MSRVVEIYAGAYASGKSETSINRARQYAKQNKDITLVDLDTVEPAYTLRPIAGKLEEEGVRVVTQLEYFGLGEAGSYITPTQKNCLIGNDGDMIIDVGYGAAGLDILDILEGVDKEENMKIYLVINTSKFETCDVENLTEYVTFSEGLEKRDWKKFDGFISNTHFGDETTSEDVVRGYEIVKEVSQNLNIPIRAIGVDRKIAADFDLTYDGVDVWVYDRIMPTALW
ncbi:MAG: hypothetical protein R3Y28_07350 [Candidatus Gastranaerophilales bacterium]